MLTFAATLYLPFKLRTKKFKFQMVNSRWLPKRLISKGKFLSTEGSVVIIRAY